MGTSSDVDHQLRFHSSLAGSWSARYRKSSFADRITCFGGHISQNLSDQSWLDAGCGTGDLSALLAARGASVHGIDGSAAMIQRANAVRSRFTNCRFELISDLEDWDGGVRQFDGIVCSSVLEYVRDPPSLLARLRRFLKESGVIVLSVPNRLSPLRLSHRFAFRVSRLFGFAGFPEYMCYSRHDYSRANLNSLLSEAGLVPTRIDYCGAPVLRPLANRAGVSPLIVVSALPEGAAGPGSNTRGATSGKP